jgi:FAD/FMN-containing dehydrogenase
MERTPMSRRRFLTQGAGAAVVLGAGLAGCGRGAPTSAQGTTTTGAPTTTGGPPDYGDLAAQLSGTVVVPSDAAYATDKQLYNTRFDTIDPAAIAYCRTATDVQRSVAFARAHGVRLAARSGGHSYGGYSLTEGGLVIDVTSMASVTNHAAAGTATVGAGTRLIDLYSQLGSAGVALPGGSCPTVGIAGLTLGGGIGVFGRLYGLTCDNLASLQLVTADGRLVTCGPEENPDLYWASRGGGGGNFGVATSFTFTVHPVPDIALFTLAFPAASAADVLGAWLAWIGSTPDELWSNCQLLSAGSAGGITVKVTGVYAGSTTACSQALAPLLAAVGTAPTYNFVGPEPYQKAMMIEAGCEGDTVAQCHLPSQNPAGILSRATFAAKSAYLTAPLPAAVLSSVVGDLQALAADVPSVGGGFVFDAYGGAINRVAGDATAFVHRDALCAIEYDVNWSPGAPAPVVAASTQWLATAQSHLDPVADGAYQNYIDPTLADWPQAYYGANLSRLMAIKRAVDPDDVFSFAQSIPVS